MTYKRILPLLVLMFLMTFAGSASAQSSPSPTPRSQTPVSGSSFQSAAELQDIETLQDQLKQRDAELAAVTKIVAEHAAKDLVQAQLIQTLTERGDFYKAEAQKRQAVDANSIQIEQLNREQKALLSDELARVREEANGLRKSRDRWRLAGIVSVAVNGYQIKR